MIAGEVDAKIQPDFSVLNDDNFNEGPQGWAQLIGGADNTHGPIMLDGEITADGSKHSLFLQTGETKATAANRFGSCMALKRLHYPDGAEMIYMRYEWAMGTEFSYKSPRTITFSLDACDKNASRHFWQVRWFNYDSSTDTYPKGYQVNAGTDSATDWKFIGLPFKHPFNENKRNIQVTEIVYDLLNNRYAGVRANGAGVGVLAASPTAWVTENNTPGGPALGPADQSLPTFEGSMNPYIQIDNNNTGADTHHSWLNLCRQRTVVTA